MKKQIKPALPAGRKLNLSKRTISNLDAAEMNQHVGGSIASVNTCYTCNHCHTYGKGHTCNYHHTCNTCG